ncbi:hypothetical protein [Burkholderia sp. BCC0405]|uniref:hypothetical protein n=1 Tax=Burkholderia sp. BCC0405 TaxID=2676298 RepID=UPI00158A8A77|nr:hypothetical protein [Burkholderia sp. BCC0405]
MIAARVLLINRLKSCAERRLRDGGVVDANSLSTPAHVAATPPSIAQAPVCE